VAALNYAEFLTQAEARLAAAGARNLLPPDPIRPAELFGWDGVLLDPQPGRSTVYGFTSGDGVTREQLAARIEGLAKAVARTQATGPLALRLVAVVVFSYGFPGGRARSYTGLSPATYYSQLRPSTWVVDLQSGQVVGGRRWRNGDTEILRETLADGGRTVLGPENVADLQRQHDERLQAFYRLMRGRRPVVTFALIAINAAIFLLMYRGGSEISAKELVDYGALVPRLVENGQWWRLFTAIFLHASIAHILFNMTSLFAVGTLCERLYGSGKFLAIYLGSGLAGSLVSFGYAVATGSDLYSPHVGASGAIFGIAGALLTVRFQRSDVIPRQVRDQISGWLIALVGINLAISFVTPYVDNSAHLGGLIGGIVLSFVFPLVREPTQVG
jgi:membrane associated rhomboid family serine protease